MTATDFGSNTVRNASRRASFMSLPPDQFTRVLRGPGRTTTRYPQSGAKALTGPRVPPILFSFSEAPMTATDFGSNTVRNASRRTSFMSRPPDQSTRILHGPADDDALPAIGRQGANGSARPPILFVFRSTNDCDGFRIQYSAQC